jgi:hypothetical protein
MNHPHYVHVYQTIRGRLHRVVVDRERRETRLEPTTWAEELAREKAGKRARVGA